MNWKTTVHYLGFAAATGCTCDFTSIEKMQSASVTCHIFHMMHWKIEDIFNGKNIANCEKSRNDLWNKINLYFAVRNVQSKIFNIMFLLFFYLY